jgi:ATP-dependent protease ClpP protease subunit
MMNTPNQTPSLSPQVPGSDRSERPSIVDDFDNHVYFYSDVNSDRTLQLVQMLREKDAALRGEAIARGMENMPPTPIWLHVNSYGGSLFTAFSVADQISMLKSPIYSVVEGICASAATLISLSCAKRYILPNSFMLIHQLSSFMWGTHQQFKDEMEVQNKLMTRLVKFYASKSKLTDDEIRTMLTRDYWMDAEETLKHGLVDEILS